MKEDKKLIGVLDTREHLKENGVVTSTNGNSYNLFEFGAEDVSLMFIANSLSKIARYNGHNKEDEIYSVAQHSVMMAEAALIAYGCPYLAMGCLVHDGGEAYTGDVVKPLKNAIKELFSEIENKIDKAVCDYFGVKYPMDTRIKEMDINMCSYEMTTLICPSERTWDLWSPERAKKNFVDMYKKILVLIEEQKQYNKTNLNG
jgi:hypothetical protein